MSIREEFFHAFASRPRPAASQLIRAEVIPQEGDRLRDFLSTVTSKELTAADIRTKVEGNLWMLTPEAFRYFLPAFMEAALESYASVSIFASELVGALTEPSRTDVVESLDRLADAPPGLGLPDDMSDLLRKQQLEWIDSGVPQAIFHNRFHDVTRAEGAAVLAFLEAFREAHGRDFPFGELDAAIERYWGRFRVSP